MMTDYTKGPWRIGRPGSIVADEPVPEISGSDDVEYYGGHLIGESVSKGNARRIVACVNACAEWPTETLENQFAGKMFVGSGLQLWVNYTDKKAEVEDLKQQRDELLAAAEKALDVCRRDYDSTDAVTVLSAAIAKVKT